jgi:hypothetical protein
MQQFKGLNNCVLPTLLDALTELCSTIGIELNWHVPGIILELQAWSIAPLIPMLYFTVSESGGHLTSF